jgi:integrase
MTGKPTKCSVHGNVRWRVDWRDAHGKRKEETFRTEADAIARQAVVNALPKVALHSLHDPAITVRSYGALWLKHNEPTWAPATLRSHTLQLTTHVYPFPIGRKTFGDLKLSDVQKPHVKALVGAKRAAGYKANSVRILFATLSAMLNEAADDEIIAASPVAVPGKSIRALTGNGKKKQRADDDDTEAANAMTADQLHAFLTMAQQRSPRLYPWYLTAARAGLRAGELCGLQLDDLAADARTAHVRRALDGRTSTRTPKAGAVKSFHSNRVVDVSRQLGAVLVDLKTRRPAVAMAYRWRPVPAWFFVTKNGTPYKQRNVLRDMVRLQRRLGWCAKGDPAPFSLHSLRHTFATLHLINGTDRNAIQYVQQQLGHSSISVTVDVYGSAIRMRDPVAADRLDALVANAGANAGGA